MEFLLGFLGAIVAAALIALGVFAGWKLRGADYARTAQRTAAELTEAEKQHVKEMNEAWNSLHDYNVETAYGLNRSDDHQKEAGKQ